MILPPLLLLGLAALAPAAQPASPERPARPVAGALVASREWIIRRAPRREEEFIGEVSYREGPSALRSDWALFRHDSKTWQARGRVRLSREFSSGDRVEASGGKADYDQKSGRGSLIGEDGGPVLFDRFPADGPPDHGSAARLDWEGQELARLSGGVRLWGPRLELRGARADYDAGRGTLSVSGGRPVLRLLEGDWIGAVQADSLVARKDPDGLRADGKAKGWLLFKERLEKISR